MHIRLEKLNFGTPGGKAKVLGSLLGVGGALILSFYKGVEINIWSTHVDLLHRDHQHNNMASSHDAAAGSGNHVLGCLLAVASSACFSVWFIIQVIFVSFFVDFLFIKKKKENTNHLTFLTC